MNSEKNLKIESPDEQGGGQINTEQGRHISSSSGDVKTISEANVDLEEGADGVRSEQTDKPVQMFSKYFKKSERRVAAMPHHTKLNKTLM